MLFACRRTAGSFRAIFEHLDADNSGQLDMAEARGQVKLP